MFCFFSNLLGVDFYCQLGGFYQCAEGPEEFVGCKQSINLSLRKLATAYGAFIHSYKLDMGYRLRLAFSFARERKLKIESEGFLPHVNPLFVGFRLLTYGLSSFPGIRYCLSFTPATAARFFTIFIFVLLIPLFRLLLLFDRLQPFCEACSRVLLVSTSFIFKIPLSCVVFFATTSFAVVTERNNLSFFIRERVL